MNIKEIIDRERWGTYDQLPHDIKAHNDSLTRIEAAVTERIEELEAQVPKVVKPALERHVSGAYYLCLCGTAFDGINRFKFCPYCGAKLNWEER